MIPNHDKIELHDIVRYDILNSKLSYIIDNIIKKELSDEILDTEKNAVLSIIGQYSPVIIQDINLSKIYSEDIDNLLSYKINSLFAIPFNDNIVSDNVFAVLILYYINKERDINSTFHTQITNMLKNSGSDHSKDITYILLEENKKCKVGLKMDYDFFSTMAHDISNLFYYNTKYPTAYINPFMPYTIESNPYRLEQIINNFLSNALKFTPERGTVSLEFNYEEEDFENTPLITLFNLILDIVEKREEEFKQTDEAVSGKTLSVMVVDDNFINLKLLAEVIKKISHKTVMTKDGAEAVELFKESNPNLIFIDKQMPKMNGIDTIKEIKKLKANKNTGIFGLTGESDKKSREEFISAGPEDVLIKAVQIKRLLPIFNHI